MKEPEHYRRFPWMIPWVGCRYDQPSMHKKLLVVGESHYLPPKSTIHLKPNNWYASNQEQMSTMPADPAHPEEGSERDWIHTSNIIRRYVGEGRCGKRAWEIYDKIADGINEFLHFEHSWEDVFEHIGYYNYFQRPGSFRGSPSVTDPDCNVSREVFDWNLVTLDPDIVVITSNKAAKDFMKHKQSQQYSRTLREKPSEVHVETAWYPSWRCWDRKISRRGDMTSREIFRSALKNYWVAH